MEWCSSPDPVYSRRRFWDVDYNGQLQQVQQQVQPRPCGDHASKLLHKLLPWLYHFLHSRFHGRPTWSPGTPGCWSRSVSGVQHYSLTLVCCYTFAHVLVKVVHVTKKKKVVVCWVQLLFMFHCCQLWSVLRHFSGYIGFLSLKTVMGKSKIKSLMPNPKSPSIKSQILTPNINHESSEMFKSQIFGAKCQC